MLLTSRNLLFRLLIQFVDSSLLVRSCLDASVGSVFGKVLLTPFVLIHPYGARWIVVISYELYKLCDSIVGSGFEKFN
jgi:hypothetical protein